MHTLRSAKSDSIIIIYIYYSETQIRSNFDATILADKKHDVAIIILYDRDKKKLKYAQNKNLKAQTQRTKDRNDSSIFKCRLITRYEPALLVEVEDIRVG